MCWRGRAAQRPCTLAERYSMSQMLMQAPQALQLRRIRESRHADGRGIMKIVLVAGVHTLGGKVETLEVDEPRPLAADEVLIDIRSAGVGNWDDIIRYRRLERRREPSAGARRRGCRGHQGRRAPTRADSVWTMRCCATLCCCATKARGRRFVIAPDRIARPQTTRRFRGRPAAIFPVPALTAEQVVGVGAHRLQHELIGARRPDDLQADRQTALVRPAGIDAAGWPVRLKGSV